MTSRLIAALPGELAAQHVPEGARDAVQHAIAAGSPPPGGASHGGTTAIELALTSGVHAGMAVTGVVFLATAVLVVAVVRAQGRAVARGERRPAEHDVVVDGEPVRQTARPVPILTRSRIDASGR